MPRQDDLTRPALFLVKPASAVAQLEIEEAKDSLRDFQMSNFASGIAAARYIFRRYPDFVTSEAFPEPYRSAYVRENDLEPGEYLDFGDLHLTDPEAYELKLQEMALQVVGSWVNDRKSAERAQESRLLAMKAASRMVQ